MTQPKAAAGLGDMTPEMIAASDTHTKGEKLYLLQSMRRKALNARKRGRDRMTDAETDIGAIDAALAAVKRESDDAAGIAIGRSTSA
jgi:hypothetical protein